MSDIWRVPSGVGSYDHVGLPNIRRSEFKFRFQFDFVTDVY